MTSPGKQVTATGEFNLLSDEGARRFQSLTEALRRLTASTKPLSSLSRQGANYEGDRSWPVLNQLSSASPAFVPASMQPQQPHLPQQSPMVAMPMTTAGYPSMHGSNTSDDWAPSPSQPVMITSPMGIHAHHHHHHLHHQHQHQQHHHHHLHHMAAMGTQPQHAHTVHFAQHHPHHQHHLLQHHVLHQPHLAHNVHQDPNSPASLVINASSKPPSAAPTPTSAAAVNSTAPSAFESSTAGDSPTAARIILVDDRLTEVWQTVVNPADAAKAASNLTRLLPAPNAYEVAAEFLTRPAHTAVIRLIPDVKQRQKLAHQVLLALVRRGSAEFAAQWPSTVRLATKTETSATADAQIAAEALGELLHKDLAPRSVVVTAMTFLLGHPRTVDFALRSLWHCALAAEREAGETATDSKPATTPAGSSSQNDGAAVAARTLYPELRDAVEAALAQTSYVALRLATAFGWRPAATVNLKFTTTLPGGPSDRIAFSASTETLVTSSSNSGLTLWDAAAVTSREPRGLLADRRIIAVDAIAKKDAIVAVAGPPDVPTLFNIDLKPKGGGAPRVSASVLMDVDSATALKTISHRSAAICLGVVANKDFELRLYTATGSADRTISKAHDDFITCIASSPDSDSTVFSGARDGVVRVWDLRTAQRSTSTLPAHQAAVSGISASRDVLLTGGLDGAVRLWDARKMVDPIDTVVFDAPVLALTSSSKGLAFVATARQLSVLTLHPLSIDDTLPSSYHALALSTNGEGLFAVGPAQRGVHVFSLK